MKVTRRGFLAVLACAPFAKKMEAKPIPGTWGALKRSDYPVWNGHHSEIVNWYRDKNMDVIMLPRRLKDVV